MLVQDLEQLFIPKKKSSHPQMKITAVCRESHTMESQNVFVAIKGNSWDGHSFIPEACLKGASAIVAENVENVPLGYSGSVIQVSDARFALDKISYEFFGRPSERLFCVGITGTNGKTTLSYLIEHLFNSSGCTAGVIGTIDHHVKNQTWTTKLTTPGSQELYSRLHEMIEASADSLVMEVSSHALDQKRMQSINFDVAVFTNLSRDHLDYHKSMENYFSAKQQMFLNVMGHSTKKNRFAVINTDDEWGKKIQVAEGVQKITFGAHSTANFKFSKVDLDFTSTHFHLDYMGDSMDVQIPLAGLHNVYNCCAALAVAYTKKISVLDAVKCFQTFKGVPGRLQAVANIKGFHVFVDYAHTDDALHSVLKFLNDIRQIKKSQIKQYQSRIITVFGAGGDRDKGKRSLMAQVACQESDVVIVTSDNPRSENPLSIIHDILKGADQKKVVHAEVDRREAIQMAIQMAKPNDVILIAGKGHENYQEIQGIRHPFDDVLVARELLS